MRGLRIAALAALCTPLVAQEPAHGGDFAVHCGRLLVGDGTELTNAWLLVHDGRIVRASAEAPPADMQVVDASGKVVMPGLVAADSDLSGAADAEYNVTPDVVAADNFDFDKSQRDALMGGVTTAYLSPGRERLISGQGSVIKLAGSDVVRRVLQTNACLRINFGDGGVAAPRVFEPTAHPTSDDPLLPARVQAPTARIAVLAELRQLFAQATSGKPGLEGRGADENRYRDDAIAAVVKGALPLRAGAEKAADVRRALLLGKELGIRQLVLENPQEIEALATDAAAQGAMATFRVPVQLGAANPGGEDHRQKSKEHFDAPAKAAQAGMTIALVPAFGVPLRDFLMAAAVAVRCGLEPAAALRAITGDAARLLGLGNRVGTLQAGRDADFLVLSGEPFAVGTMVETTWIDGKVAFARKSKANQLAVRCGRILDAEGHVFRNGVVLCEDGRIKAVGEDLSIPFGARVVDLPHGVMTPGLLDAFSHLGLAGDGQPVPACTPNQKIAEAIAFDDPMFGAATAAGLTTALVSGKDGGQLSGRIAAIKLGARDQAAMVVRAVAGQRFLVDGVGADAARPLQEQLDRAKKYRQTFIDYDKAVAEQKAGGKAEPPKAEPPKAPPTPPAAEDPLTGTWESTVEVPGGSPLKAYLELRLEGTAVTGRVRLVLGTRELPAQEITSGSFQAGKLKLEFRGTGSSATVEAEVKGEEMTGKVALPQMGEQNFTGKRTSKPASKPAPATAPATDAKSEAPKKPPVDEGLEPLRQCLDKTATLVVRCNRGPAIKAVVELLQKEQVPFVLHGADGLLDEADLLGASHPAVLLEPEIVREQDGELQNAAAMLADRGHPVLLGSGQCGGARFLPLHAAYAVRYGMSPVDALLAITRATAQAFQLDDRVGSLRKGKDADFVVFSGDPFEPTSRVLLVAVNGEIAIDNRSAATAEAGK